WAIPKGCAEDRVIIGLHGGGFATGSMYTHRKLFGHIAKTAGTRALIVNFRRTPEHPYPAAVDDAIAAYRWLLDQGGTANRGRFGAGGGGGGPPGPASAPRPRPAPARPGRRHADVALARRGTDRRILDHERRKGDALQAQGERGQTDEHVSRSGIRPPRSVG